MYVSRLLVRNFRNLRQIDVSLRDGVTCVVGENNVGKTNLLYALRLALDPSLSLNQRRLAFPDFFAGVDPTKPSEIIICVEFSDFKDKPNEEAMVGPWSIEDGLARLTFRFRPSRKVREEIEGKQRAENGLTQDDYRFEYCGGGPGDPSSVSWKENLGSAVSLNDLQQFIVTTLAPLRDVEQSLRQIRHSPLGKLLEASEIPKAEQDKLVSYLRQANSDVSKSPTIKSVASDVSKAFADAAGAFSLSVDLGMVAPDFSSIVRGLTPLLSTGTQKGIDIARNGLGLNNVLYIVLLVRSFERNVSTGVRHRGWKFRERMEESGLSVAG